MSDIDTEAFKNSKTYLNLQTAFAGEAQARVKYQFYASQAKKDGYEQISAIFNETSDNEKVCKNSTRRGLHRDCNQV